MNSTPISAIITMNDSHLRGLIISYFRTADEMPNKKIGKNYATVTHRIKMIQLIVAFKMIRKCCKEYAEIQHSLTYDTPSYKLMKLLKKNCV